MSVKHLHLSFLSVFLLLSLSVCVYGDVYNTYLGQASPISAETAKVILQNGTAGTSTIYTNNTSAKVSVASLVWWNSSWGYRKLLSINNTQNSNSLSNYQVFVNITYDADMKMDFSDLRFTWYNVTSNEEQEIFYWVEKKVDSTYAETWIAIPEILSYTYYSEMNTTVKMYYGNPSVSSASNFDDTFTKNYGETGLAGLWHMDEGAGTTTADSSSNGNTGAITNAAWEASDGGQWDGRTNVKFSTGSALSFDGVNDVVNAGSGTSLDNINSAITIEAWIYPTGWGEYSTYGYGRIVDKDKFIIYLHDTASASYNDHSLIFTVYVGGATYPSSTPTDSIQLNQWQHVAVTYNGATVKMYINGVVQTLVQPSGAPSGNIDVHSAANFLMGDSAASDRCFEGKIDEVRIYNRILSQEEIRAHYERRKYTSPEPTVEIITYDYVDNNTSDIGSPTDRGTHSNFTAQQHGPDSVNDTLTEENTGPTSIPIQNMNFTSNLSSWTTNNALWENVGSPLSGAGSVYYRVSGGWTSGTAYCQQDFTVSFIPTSAVLTWYWKKSYSGNVGTCTIWVELIHGATTKYSWTNTQIGNIGWTWESADVTSNIDSTGTWTLRLRWSFQTQFGGSSWVQANFDDVGIKLTTSTNYELDLEVQWTNANYNETNEELCIYGGTMGAENLTVDVWYNSAWQNVFTNLSSGWNNVSVSSYLNSPTFTIRFKGSTETGDTTQDSWNIDATLLHVWTPETYDYVLRVNNTITNSWQIRLKKYSDSNINRLQNCTIYFHNSTDGTLSQIQIENGDYTPSGDEGSWHDLHESETIYIAMTAKTNSTGTSYIYTFLEIRVPNTTTYFQCIITFQIT